jgi:hypothetical protein
MAVAGIDVALHALAGILVRLGSLLAQGVHATMHIGIDTTIALGNAVYHALRML